ncbi:MAG TPA: ribosome maturation factor RimM [Polyangia bacterium]|nr:ribosome maturation factor RimM [Polyangia bacterium]
MLGRPHGVTGEIALRPYNPQGRSLAAIRRLTLARDGRREVREVLACRVVGGGYLLRFEGVADREAAAALTLAEVRVSRSALPPLAPGEYYVEDVPGCAVEDEAGRPLGTAVGTFWNGAHDVVTVAGPGGAEHLIPLVPDFVLTVDAPGRKITVRWDAEP